MDSHSSQASTGMGSTSAPTIVQYLEHSRNPEIWCGFDLVLLSDGAIKAHCKRCQRFMSKEANSTLKKHMNQYCPMLKVNAEAGQSSMTREGGVFLYDAEACRQQLANFVIQEGLPFNHFDNPRLTKVIQRTLQPRYNNVSRATLKRDCMKLWKKSKQELINIFENINTNINLTTDVWSAPHGLPGSYLCVTAHWIDPVSWQMIKRTIAFENFEYPHTGQNLFILLRNVIRMYKLENKIFSISFDNASNNTSAVRHLILKYTPTLGGKFFHSRCLAHIINLVVQDGLAAVEDVRNDFKKMLQDIFTSGKTRYVKYMRLCKETDKLFLTPNWDVPTRWNSTYNMFLCGLRQRETLQLFHDDLAARGKVTQFPVENWEIIQQITELLKIFKTATTLLSGVYYPTSPLALNQLFLICSKISEFELTNNLFSNMVGPMKQKLRKYFREIPPVITCAAALNPCLNISGVEMLIDQIVNDLDLHLDDVMFAHKAKNHFNTCFKELFDVYFDKFGTASTSSTPFSDPYSGSVSTDPAMYLYNMVRRENTKRARGEGSQIHTSEYGRYIGTDFVASMGLDEFRAFDILAWWKGRESQFPVLAAMAKDLLTVQASTVASESCFSFSGRVLSIRRTRLTPASLEMCICLKDHLDASERIQNTANLEGDPDFEREVLDVEVAEGLTISLSDEELALDEASRVSSEEENIIEDEANIFST